MGNELMGGSDNWTSRAAHHVRTALIRIRRTISGCTRTVALLHREGILQRVAVRAGEPQIRWTAERRCEELQRTHSPRCSRWLLR